MIISSNKNSSYYIEDFYSYYVYRNGELLNNCIEASEEDGFAIIHRGLDRPHAVYGDIRIHRNNHLSSEKLDKIKQKIIWLKERKKRKALINDNLNNDTIIFTSSNKNKQIKI